ncbi:MAG: hypothetical protein QOF26_2008 [Baekduia sp.]|jgi:hypothetical protein|nr:hypothetical protein [Baekduia sp.]
MPPLIRAARRLPSSTAGLLVAGALVVAGCGSGGGSGATTTAPTARMLQGPGASWAGLTPHDRRAAIKACRLQTAVSAAREEGASTAPFYSDRYRAIEQVADGKLGPALDRWFTNPAHDREAVQQGCTTLARGLSNVDAVARRPHVSFALPVTTGDGPFTLKVDEPTAELLGRITPTGTRVSLERPADRSRTTATWTIRRQDDTVRIALRNIPLGVSYVRVVVDGPGGRAGRLLVLTRERASRLGPARTFRPIALHGTGSRTLPVMLIPVRAVATVQTDGTPLALVTDHTLLLAHDAGRTGPSPISPGAYRAVRVAAAGPWTLKIAPATP